MPKKINEQTFGEKTRRFFSIVACNKIDSLKILFYFSVEGFFGVLFIFFIQDITAVLESGLQDNFIPVLIRYAFYFGILFIILGCIHNWWSMTYNRFKKTIEKEYLPRYVTFDMNIQEKIGTGKSIAIISKGIKMWAGLMDKLLMELINIVLSLGLTIYLLLQVDIKLVFILLFLLFVTISIGLFLNSYVVELRRNRIELDNLWSKGLVKIIMAKNEILQSKKIDVEVGKLAEFNEGQIFYNKKMSFYMVPFFALGPIIVIVLLYIIFIYFGNLYFTGNITLSVIAGLSGAIIMMQKVFMNTLDFLKNFTKEFAEVQNLWSFFDDTPQIKGYEEGETFIHKDGAISLKNISYGYDESHLVLRDFNLEIPGNRVTALVGPSGGGKSTLVKLISGYISQDSGDICVDGQNLKEISLKSYFKDIGYLTQEPSVFDGTIIENLLYAVNFNISQKEIEKNIRLAHCEFIYDLANGLETEIGERGVKLSGGQKQRLAIAKIFLKNPKIIILDEPTSALDSLSEKKITEAMHNLFQDRTVLVIAHRLQTVKHADDIIVIENGYIKERGTHKQLVKQKGFYKQMLDLQSGF